MALNNLAAEIKRSYGTQAAFAEALGVDQGSVCNWLSEKTYPSIAQCRRIRALLGCTVDYLFETDTEEQ